MAHCYDMRNTIVVAINFCNEKKINCALMYNINNHYGIKCLCNLLLLEPCNVVFKLFLTQWHIGMICEILLLLQRRSEKMNCSLMFNISNYYGIKCNSNLLQIVPCNVMFKVICDEM